MTTGGSRQRVAREVRFAARLPSVVHLLKNDYECTTHDLSRTGVLVRGRFPRLVGYRVEISFRDASGNLSPRLAGRVVRARRTEAEEQSLALKFMELTGSRLHTLEAILSRVIEGHSPASIGALRPGASDEEVRRALEEVPVAHRISLALRANVREREFLRRDRNPQVLEALARNPGLLPAEARALAAAPLLKPSTLELLSRDPRWSNDDELRIALASHPRVPVMLAQTIADGLSPQSLQKLIRTPGVPPAVRTRLHRRLRRA